MILTEKEKAFIAELRKDYRVSQIFTRLEQGLPIYTPEEEAEEDELECMRGLVDWNDIDDARAEFGGK